MPCNQMQFADHCMNTNTIESEVTRIGELIRKKFLKLNVFNYSTYIIIMLRKEELRNDFQIIPA